MTDFKQKVLAKVDNVSQKGSKTVKTKFEKAQSHQVTEVPVPFEGDDKAKSFKNAEVELISEQDQEKNEGRSNILENQMSKTVVESKVNFVSPIKALNFEDNDIEDFEIYSDIIFQNNSCDKG